jgi:hypothetical protein
LTVAYKIKGLNIPIDDYKLPIIVNIGNESSGKSSLIRNILKCDIFPIDKSLCTKCPIKIELINSTNNEYVISFKDKTINLVHSTVRTGSPIPGVLIITGNKTYGRQKNNAGKKPYSNNSGKLLYKCIPDDIRLPSFLIPYEIKNVGFSKVNKNLYVTFIFEIIILFIIQQHIIFTLLLLIS